MKKKEQHSQRSERLCRFANRVYALSHMYVYTERGQAESTSGWSKGRCTIHVKPDSAKSIAFLGNVEGSARERGEPEALENRKEEALGRVSRVYVRVRAPIPAHALS